MLLFNNDSTLKTNITMNTDIKTGEGAPMPLLMSFTRKNKIEEAEGFTFTYDEMNQITIYCARDVGTRSYRPQTTKKKTSTGYSSTTDRKNSIDDVKQVK